jgi:hypothetical protein
VDVGGEDLFKCLVIGHPRERWRGEREGKKGLTDKKRERTTNQSSSKEPTMSQTVMKIDDVLGVVLIQSANHLHRQSSSPSEDTWVLKALMSLSKDLDVLYCRLQPLVSDINCY